MPKRTLLRSLMVVAVAMAMSVLPDTMVPNRGAAQAQNLFEALFPRASQRRRARADQRRRARAARDRRAWERRQARRKKASSRSRGTAQRKRAQRKKTRARQKPARRVASAPTSYVRPVFAPYTATDLAPVNLKKLAAKTMRDNDARERALQDAASIASRDRIGRIALTVAATQPVALTFASSGAELLDIDLRAEREAGLALRNHYATQPRFLWLDEAGRPNEAASSLIALMERADEHALDPAHYALPRTDIRPVALTGIDVADAAAKREALEFELGLTLSAMRYLKDARHGRVTPNRLSRYHDFASSKTDWKKLLAEIADAADPAELLASAHPDHPAYEALLSALRTASTEPAGPPPVVVAPGTFLKPGWSNPELANIVEGIRRKASAETLAKHADTLSAYDGSPKYTKALVQLVRDFQREKGLGADGIVGRNTLAKLVDRRPKDRKGKIELAIERLRWHPSTFGRRHVFINQPAYRASYMVDGRAQLSMNVVVGKTANQTNFFHDEIEYVEFNPYWGIPQSILVNEYLPRLRRDPSYLDRKGYLVTNSRGKTVRSSSIDWWSMSNKVPYAVRQKPGPRNALGELKIMFPNKHDIYMHDTPAKKLFAREKRAYSHGCVRLADPRAMAAAVLGKPESFVRERLGTGKNNATKLKSKVPVYVSYFTAWPKADGTVAIYEDVYGRDKALKRALEMERAERARATRV